MFPLNSSARLKILRNLVFFPRSMTYAADAVRSPWRLPVAGEHGTKMRAKKIRSSFPSGEVKNLKSLLMKV